MSEKAADIMRFGAYELDLGSRELRQAGQLVALEPRVFALLVYLYEQRHRAVDKDELQDAVWKGVIVSETALTRAIMKARRAVSDSADKQAVIRTVHGHGYQFVAPAAEEAADVETVAAASKQRIGPPAVLVAAGILAVVAVVVFLWPTTAPPERVRLAIMPVHNATGEVDYDWTRLGLMGFANDLINRQAEFNILPASDVVRFDERHKGTDDGEDRDGDLGQLRDAYGASHMLTSTLEKSAGVLRLSYSLHRPNGEIDRGTMVGAQPTALMRGMVRSVAQTLGNHTRAVDEITVVSEDPFVNEAYSRGLSLALEGRCDGALQLFAVVMANADTVGTADYEWANCSRILGRWQEAEAAFEKILAGISVEPASALRAQALNGLGTVYIRTGRGDIARETFQRGLSEAQRVGDYRLQSRLLNSLAIEAKDRRVYDAARALLGRARLAHTEARAGAVPGQLPAALANIDMAEAKFDEAEGHLQEALTAFRALGDRRNEAMMLNNFGYLRRLQGQWEAAEPLHLQSLEIRREIGDVVGQGRILGMLSTIYESSGRLQEAKDAASEAYQIASKANDRLFMATSLAQLARVEVSANEYVAARRHYLESRTIFEEIEDYSRAAQTTVRLARLDLRVGDYFAAHKRVVEVLDIARREALPEPAIEALELSGDIALAQSDPERAISAYRDAVDYVDESGFVGKKAGIVSKLVHTLLKQQKLATAEPLIGYLIEHGEWSDADAQVLAEYRESAVP